MYGAFLVILQIVNISKICYVCWGLAFYEKSLWVFGGPLGCFRKFLEVSGAYGVKPVEVEIMIKHKKQLFLCELIFCL